MIKILLLAMSLNGYGYGTVTIQEYPSMEQCLRDQYYYESQDKYKDLKLLCAEYISGDTISA